MMRSQEERVMREKAAREYEAKKDRALDFASSLGVVVAVRMFFCVSLHVKFSVHLNLRL